MVSESAYPVKVGAVTGHSIRIGHHTVTQKCRLFHTTALAVTKFVLIMLRLAEG